MRHKSELMTFIVNVMSSILSLKSSYFQVATMVIVLLSPTLQTPVMDRLSSTRLGIIPMGIIRGYERYFQTSHWFCLFDLCCLLEWFLKCVSCVFTNCSRMVTNRIISAELARDPEECREAALRQCDPERPFIMTVTDKLAPH